jgi:integrase
VSASTKRRYPAAVHSFVSYLREMGILTTNPLRNLPAPPPGPPRSQFLELPDVVRLIEGSVRPYQAIFTLAYGAGLEVSAILAATETDVDYAARTLRARGTKAWNGRAGLPRDRPLEGLRLPPRAAPSARTAFA